MSEPLTDEEVANWREGVTRRLGTENEQQDDRIVARFLATLDAVPAPTLPALVSAAEAVLRELDIIRSHAPRRLLVHRDTHEALREALRDAV